MNVILSLGGGTGVYEGGNDIGEELEEKKKKGGL